MKMRNSKIIFALLVLVTIVSCEKRKLARELENNIYGEWLGLHIANTTYSNGNPPSNHEFFIRLTFFDDNSASYVSNIDSLNYYWRIYENLGQIYLAADTDTTTNYSRIHKFNIIETSDKNQLWQLRIIRNEGEENETITTLSWDLDKVQ